MSDMTCCPLSGSGDCPAPEAFTSRRVHAGRAHRCCECDHPIAKGESHEIDKGLWDGRWDTFRTCLLCVEIRGHFDCGGGWIYECLWSDLEENFFPDMRAGGPCMDGLSPAAKGKLFDMRLAWVLLHDEYLRCDLAVPPGWSEPA